MNKFTKKVLRNHILYKNHIGYEVKIEDKSILFSDGWKYDYTITFYFGRRKKILFWKYNVFEEFDRFLLRPKNGKSIKPYPTPLKTKNYSDLEKIVEKLGLENVYRSLGCDIY